MANCGPGNVEERSEWGELLGRRREMKLVCVRFVQALFRATQESWDTSGGMMLAMTIIVPAHMWGAA